MDEQYAVTVTRPGRAPVRIGPIPWKHQAHRMAATLSQILCQMIAASVSPQGTSIRAAVYDPELPHTPLLPEDACALVEAIGQEPKGDPEDRFPDTYARLVAQVGWDRGNDLWSSACALMDEPAVVPDDWEGTHFYFIVLEPVVVGQGIAPTKAFYSGTCTPGLGGTRVATLRSLRSQCSALANQEYGVDAEWIVTAFDVQPNRL